MEESLSNFELRPVPRYDSDNLIIVVPLFNVTQFLLLKFLGQRISHHGVEYVQVHFLLNLFAQLLQSLIELCLIAVETYFC